MLLAKHGVSYLILIYYELHARRSEKLKGLSPIGYFPTFVYSCVLKNGDLMFSGVMDGSNLNLTVKSQTHNVITAFPQMPSDSHLSQHIANVFVLGLNTILVLFAQLDVSIYCNLMVSHEDNL